MPILAHCAPCWLRARAAHDGDPVYTVAAMGSRCAGAGGRCRAGPAHCARLALVPAPAARTRAARDCHRNRGRPPEGRAGARRQRRLRAPRLCAADRTWPGRARYPRRTRQRVRLGSDERVDGDGARAALHFPQFRNPRCTTASRRYASTPVLRRRSTAASCSCAVRPSRKACRASRSVSIRSAASIPLQDRDSAERSVASLRDGWARLRAESAPSPLVNARDVVDG
jgi:hypothetical protein